jgi:hypothetical protein
MKKHFLYLIIGLSFYLNSPASNHTEVSDYNPINDGPYIFKEDNKLKVIWIDNNALREEYLMPDNFAVLKKKFNLLCDFNDLKDTYSKKPDYDQSYNMVDSIAIITDIHGEYKTYISLLKALGIIDNNLNWKFGKGHLVVLGDIFDRGDMVTEVLWHLFCLEKQALNAGGMVHVLLGNHEFLMFSKDLSYTNEKYKKVEEISDIKYFDLYSKNSVLGKWLLSKPVMITINDIIFVHAGISIEMVRRNLKIKQINQKFSNKIIGKDMESVFSDEGLSFLIEENGPLWYRGYFYDTSFCESRLDSILDFYGKEHIAVGHTPNKEIKPLFNNKIIGIDAGILYKRSGEMLLYKEGSFYRGFITGKRIKL